MRVEKLLQIDVLVAQEIIHYFHTPKVTHPADSSQEKLKELTTELNVLHILVTLSRLINTAIFFSGTGGT